MGWEKREIRGEFTVKESGYKGLVETVKDSKVENKGNIVKCIRE